MKRLALTLCVVLFTASQAMAADWPQVSRAVAEAEAQTRSQARQTREIIKKETATLTAERNALKKRIAKGQARFDALKARHDELLKREKALEEELAAQAHELKTIDGTIRTSAKQARNLFHESLTSPEFPRRDLVLKEVLRPDVFPGLQGIQNLLGLYLDEMRASGSVVVGQSPFIGPEGTTAQGDVLRIGTFTAAYRLPDGAYGFLRPGSDGERLASVSGEPGWALSGVMEDYFEGRGASFPVDISNGAALARLAQEQKSVWEWLQAGGFLVWPIILVGAIAAVLVVERFFFLGRIRSNSDRNMTLILKMVAKGEWDQCREFCRSKSSFPTCRIIGHTLEHLGGTREIIENAFQEGLLKEMPMLERFLPTLNVLAAVAPLLGLLGTVTGMINTFQVITLYGTGDPRMMSGGISEALVTTQLGLAVAVPIMVLHHVLDRRVDKILGDMEEKGTGFAVALMKNGHNGSAEDLNAAA